MDDAELRKYLNRLEYKINFIGSIVGGTVAFAAAAYVSHELQIQFDCRLIGGPIRQQARACHQLVDFGRRGRRAP
jgi:hypothetical protein